MLNTAEGALVKEYSYVRKDRLLTPTEAIFFDVLSRAVNRQQFYIATQVRMSGLFSSRGKNYYGGFQRISRKSIDYVICTLKNLYPVCAIELDDDSHLRPSRIKRDEVVNEVFEKAGLPLLRIPVDQLRDMEALKTKLSKISVPRFIAQEAQLRPSDASNGPL